MSDVFYYARGGQKHGPFTLEQCRRMAVAGLLTPSDMIFEEGQGKWQSAGSISKLFPDTAVVPNQSSIDIANASVGVPSDSPSPFPSPMATGGQKIPTTTVEQSGESRNGLIASSRSEPASLLDRFLAFATVASIPCWLLNELLGWPALLVAGAIWFAVGVRALVTGRTPAFSVVPTPRPVAFRMMGVLITCLGTAMVIGAVGKGARLHSRPKTPSVPVVPVETRKMPG